MEAQSEINFHFPKFILIQLSLYYQLCTTNFVAIGRANAGWPPEMIVIQFPFRFEFQNSEFFVPLNGCLEQRFKVNARSEIGRTMSSKQILNANVRWCCTLATGERPNIFKFHLFSFKFFIKSSARIGCSSLRYIFVVWCLVTAKKMFAKFAMQTSKL